MFRRRRLRRSAIAIGAGLAAALAATGGELQANGSTLTPETACIQIRAGIKNLAQAEGNEALALHLMSGGKPTPMVETRLTELKARAGELREVLRRVRHEAPPSEQHVSECIELGFRSLNEAEALITQVQEVVTKAGGGLSVPPSANSDQPGGVKGVPEPPLPGAPAGAEPP